MVTIYEVICDKCKVMFHMFTIDRNTKPRDGLLCTACEKSVGLQQKRAVRTLRKQVTSLGTTREIGDLIVFCGFTQDAQVFEPRMVSIE